MNSPNSAGASGLTLAAIGASVVLLAVAVFVVARNWPGNGGGSGSAGVGLHIATPAGWQEVAGENGQMMALRAEDLRQDVPAGPRIVVRSSDMYASPSIWANGALSSSDPRTTFMTEAPSTVTVGTAGILGTQVTIQETIGGRSITSRQVIVPLGRGRSVLITLAAPTEQFASHRANFESALKAATIPR